VSPLRGEKPQNRPLSKRNTGRFALRAMLPVITWLSLYVWVSPYFFYILSSQFSFHWSFPSDRITIAPIHPTTLVPPASAHNIVLTMLHLSRYSFRNAMHFIARQQSTAVGLQGAPKTRSSTTWGHPQRLIAHVFKTPETICTIFDTLWVHSVHNTSVNSNIIKFITESGATWWK